ncbi:MAG: hypothetical protein LW720_13595 [Pirellula sp.]|nr:hypothetical protein [Pirellula sp.]
MPNAIEFMDCQGCGKRVRTTARRCHHCSREFQPELLESPREIREEEDFDYEDFLEREFGHKPRHRPRAWWWYVAWVVLAVMILGIAFDTLRLIPTQNP